MSLLTLWRARKWAPSFLRSSLLVCNHFNMWTALSPSFKGCYIDVSTTFTNPTGPTVEQQTEMARTAGRTLASLFPEQVLSPSLMIWNDVMLSVLRVAFW